MLTNKFKLILLTTIITAGVNTQITAMEMGDSIKKEKTEKVSEPGQDLVKAIIAGKRENLETIIYNNRDLLTMTYYLGKKEYYCKNGHKGITKSLQGLSPLHIACIYGQLDIIKYLMEDEKICAKADVKDADGWVPLYYACLSGRKDIVEYLCENGLYVNPKEGIYVAGEEYDQDVNILNLNCNCIKNGPNIDPEEGDKSIFISDLMKLFVNEDIYKYLKKENMKNTDSQMKQLHHAITEGNSEKFEKIITILERKFPKTNSLFKYYVETIGGRGDSDQYWAGPLVTACECGNLNVIKYFIEEKGINPRNYDKSFYPLFHASGSVNVVKYFMAKGYEAKEIHRGNGLQLIHEACWAGKLNVVKYLIEELKIVSPNEATNYDNNFANFTPMAAAFMGQQQEIINYLMEKHKIEINSINENIKFNAIFFKNYEFLKYILEKIRAGVTLNPDYLVDNNGDTIVKALIRYPESILKIITNNNNLYNDGIKRILKQKENANDLTDDVTILLKAALLYAWENKYANKTSTNKNFINNFVNTYLLIKMLKSFVPYCIEKKPTKKRKIEDQEYQKKYIINHSNITGKTTHQAFIDDNLRHNILPFIKYTCLDDPKQAITMLRDPKFQASLENKFHNGNITTEFHTKYKQEEKNRIAQERIMLNKKMEKEKRELDGIELDEQFYSERSRENDRWDNLEQLAREQENKNKEKTEKKSVNSQEEKKEMQDDPDDFLI